MASPVLSVKALGGSNATVTSITSDATYALARPDLVSGVPSLAMTSHVQNCTVRTFIDGVFNTSLTISTAVTPILTAFGGALTVEQIAGLTFQVSGLQYADKIRVTDEVIPATASPEPPIARNPTTGALEASGPIVAPGISRSRGGCVSRRMIQNVGSGNWSGVQPEKTWMVRIPGMPKSFDGFVIRTPNGCPIGSEGGPMYYTAAVTENPLDDGAALTFVPITFQDPVTGVGGQPTVTKLATPIITPTLSDYTPYPYTQTNVLDPNGPFLIVRSYSLTGTWVVGDTSGIGGTYARGAELYGTGYFAWAKFSGNRLSSGAMPPLTTSGVECQVWGVDVYTKNGGVTVGLVGDSLLACVNEAGSAECQFRSLVQTASYLLHKSGIEVGPVSYATGGFKITRSNATDLDLLLSEYNPHYVALKAYSSNDGIYNRIRDWEITLKAIQKIIHAGSIPILLTHPPMNLAAGSRAELDRLESNAQIMATPWGFDIASYVADPAAPNNLKAEYIYGAGPHHSAAGYMEDGRALSIELRRLMGV